MLFNYLRTAWRGLIKNPVYSLINIGGLGAALCACLLILVYIVHEYSFDIFQKNKDHLFSIYGSTPAYKDSRSEGMSFVTGPMVAQSTPSVEGFTRLWMFPEKIVLARDGNNFIPRKPMFADSNFFQRFSFRLEEGDPATVLTRPFSIVITRSLAKTCFGNENPIGRQLTYNNKYSFEVTGVAADPPTNAYLDFDALCSLSSFHSMTEMAWLQQDANVQPGNFKTYLFLRDPRDAPRVTEAVNRLFANPIDTQYRKFFSDYSFALEPMQREHLELFNGRSANHQYLKVFSLVAALILGLALINYMSLATARASVRAAEIGVRKTLGAGRGNLAVQFYVESSLCAVLAFVVGLGLFILLKPAFLDLLQLHIDTAFMYSPRVLGAIGLLMLATILLAGSYPALVLSSFNPVNNLRAPRVSVRKVLTVLQFTVATAMIVSLSIMKQQLYFFLHKDIGMNRDHLLMIPYDKTMAPHIAAFQAEVDALPQVTKTSITSTGLFGSSAQMTFNDGAYAGKHISVTFMQVDSAYFDALQIKWKIRPGDRYWASSNKNVIINEKAIQVLGLPADPRGQHLPLGTVAGVVRDFNFESLVRESGPLMMSAGGPDANVYAPGGYILIRTTATASTAALLTSIQRIYRRYPSIFPFAYSFADESYNKLYQPQTRMAGLLGAFTLLTIVIACLGLFGLSTFSTLQRTKEVGIRKVLGAGVGNLVRLLTADFLTLVGLAVLIAAPVAWWVMHNWLQQFAYRTSVSPWILAVSGLGVGLLALLTVGIQAFRAARANPVDSLRTE
jgi:putative ABC transport system permease protein